MNILLLSLGKHPSPGGVDTYIRMVTKAMEAKGHTVELLCYNQLGTLPEASIYKINQFHNLMKEKYQSKLPPFYIVLEVQKFAFNEIIANYDFSKIDVVHSQSGILSKVMKEVYPSIPVVGTIHSSLYTDSIVGNWVNKLDAATLFAKFDNYAIESPDEVITISTEVDKNLPLIPTKKRNIVFNAIDTDEFLPQEEKSSEKVRIATSGFLTRTKGYDILFEAVTSISKKYQESIEISLFGDGPEKGKLISYANNHQLPVTFHGYIDRHQLVRLLPTYDLFIQPSRAESFCLAVTEAMASGCVPICSKVEGGMLDQVKHMDNGLLFENENVKDLSEKLELLIQNSNLRKKLSIGAVNTARSKFSLKVFADSLEMVYQKAINKL
ncbi:glycosyltransferase family 4 protein [Radiobacillus deserti]|nr:glycosyltransferase family 4 protein [Radiobacillus deserti]